jgi:RHS repeat-associated protein
MWSAQALSDSSGAVVERYVYDAYGSAVILDAGYTPLPLNAWGTPHSPAANPFLYTGRELDEESGLYFYRARYYDSALGRFLQRDPAGYDGGLNLYEYAASSPVRWSDPFGLVKASILIEYKPVSFVTDHYYAVSNGKKGKYLYGEISLNEGANLWSMSASMEAPARQRGQRMELGDVTVKTDSSGLEKFTFPQVKTMDRWKPKGKTAWEAVREEPNADCTVQCKSHIYQVSYKEEAFRKHLFEEGVGLLPAGGLIAKASKAVVKFVGASLLDTKEKTLTIVLVVCGDDQIGVSALNLPRTPFGQPSAELPIPGDKPPTEGVTRLHTRSFQRSDGTTKITSHPGSLDSLPVSVYEAAGED